MKLESQASVLLVEDVVVAAEYYHDKLGFEFSYFAENPRHYAYVNRDDVWIHFACFHGARPRPNSEVVPPDMFDVYIYVDDVDALHEELVERGADLLHGPADQAYGCREIRARDPHGYILAFGKLLT